MSRATQISRFAGLLLALSLAVGAPIASGQGTDSLAPADTVARATGPLRSGDLLNLRVYRDSELTGKYLIDAQGNVQIPGLGVLRVAGLTPSGATARLTEALRDRGFRTPEIAVWPEIRISVLGEVRTPGLYSVEPGASLIEVVTLAGGPTPHANLGHAQVVRDRHVRVVDLRQAIGGSPRHGEQESGSPVLTLYSNDIVFVPPRRSVFTQENITLAATFLSLVFSAVTLIRVTR